MSLPCFWLHQTTHDLRRNWAVLRGSSAPINRKSDDAVEPPTHADSVAQRGDTWRLHCSAAPWSPSPPTCADNCNDLGVHGSTVTTYEMKTYARNGTEYELWWSLQQYSMADWPQILVLEIAFLKTTIIFRDTITLQHLNMFDRWSTAVEFSSNSTTKSSYGGEFLSPSVTFIIGRPL
jgi:hypothetical protein